MMRYLSIILSIKFEVFMKRIVLNTIALCALFSSFANDAEALSPCDLSAKADMLPQLKVVTVDNDVELLLINAQGGQPTVLKVYYSMIFINEGFLAAGTLSLQAQERLAVALNLKDVSDKLQKTLANLQGSASVTEKNAMIVSSLQEVDIATLATEALSQVKSVDAGKQEMIIKSYGKMMASYAAMGAIVQELANMTLSIACIAEQVKNQDPNLISEIANAAALSPELVKTWPSEVKTITGNAKSFKSTSKQTKKMFKKVSKTLKIELPAYEMPKPKESSSDL